MMIILLIYIYLFISAKECKNKWKIIRSSYIRSLNTKAKSGSKAGAKKEYYLGQYLRFLNPFTKNRPQEGNLNTPHTEIDSSQEEVEIIASSNTQDEYQYMSSPPEIAENRRITKVDNRQDENVQSPSDNSSSLPSHPSTDHHTSKKYKYQKNINKKEINSADQCAIDYFTSKKKKYEMTNEQKDPCEHFLLSIVPYMKSMSQLEQLSFQKGVLNLIENTIKSRQQLQRPQSQGSSYSDQSSISTHNQFFQQSQQSQRRPSNYCHSPTASTSTFVMHQLPKSQLTALSGPPEQDIQVTLSDHSSGIDDARVFFSTFSDVLQPQEEPQERLQ